MTYTVKQLAELAHISVRTLHHYDELGLLKPSFIQKNGYRAYEEKELLRLQQILFFRELELPLDEIKDILDAPGFNIVEALKDHKKLIQIKAKRLNGLLQTIDKTISKMTDNKDTKDEELYGSFSKTEMEECAREAKERWGHTDAYKQSAERTKNWNKEDYDKVKEEQDVFCTKMVSLMHLGPKSDEIQEMVQQCRDGISRFYDCSLVMFRNLGKMYVEDPRFTANYDKYKPGLAQFLHEGIEYYCDVREGKKAD